MKKNILHFLLVGWCVIFLNNIAFGDCGQCKISNGPADPLNSYLTNLKKVRSNLTKEISKIQDDKSKIKKDIDATSSKIISTFNNIINWGGYYSLFDFYVMYSVKNDYVPEIRRDYNLLESESKGMEKYMKYVTSKGFDRIEISQTQVCEGVENCNFSGNILDVIGEIIKNHEAMKDYYRLSIVGKKNDFDGKIQMVDINFMTDFGEYYNESTTNHCSQCEKGGFSRIQEEIEKISNWQKNAKDGMKSWQDAIAMLQGNQDKYDYERKERELLQKQLARDGTSAEASENALKNLKKYNDGGGFSLDNNFITNSFDHVKNMVTSQIKSFRDTVLEQFKGKDFVPASNFNNNRNSLNVSRTVEESIKTLYQNELPFAQIQDTSSDDLQGKIIELHYNLAQSINSMDKTKKISEKVCNDQGQGLGSCGRK